MPGAGTAAPKIGDVLRLSLGEGLSLPLVAAPVQVAFTTVGHYVRRANAAGLSWPLPRRPERETPYPVAASVLGTRGDATYHTDFAQRRPTLSMARATSARRGPRSACRREKAIARSLAGAEPRSQALAQRPMYTLTASDQIDLARWRWSYAHRRPGLASKDGRATGSATRRPRSRSVTTSMASSSWPTGREPDQLEQTNEGH